MSLRFYLFLLLLQTIHAFECVPPSCVIDVIESGKYTFGIKKDPAVNFTSCSYRTNTNLSGSFQINLPSRRRPDRLTKTNAVSDYGNVGLCQMLVENVDDTGPTFWSLRPSDDEKKQNFREVNFTVNFFYKTSLLSDTVHVIEEGSFYQYFNANVKFLSCEVIFNSKEIDLDVNSIQVGNGDERVTSLGEGLCGFYLTNATVSDAVDWSLIGEASTNKRYKATFKVNVFARPSAKDTKIKKSVVIGSSTTIQCGDKFNQDFCYLYNPKGKFVTTNPDCSYSIKTVAIHHLGTWKCRVGKFPSMQTLDYSIEILSTERASVKKWIRQNDKFVKIGCQVINYHKITSCRMISPNNQVLNLRPGAAYDRYLSFGTNFENSTCALMIKKPLVAGDKGQWRCEIYSDNIRTGAFIFVQNSTLPSYKTYKTITTQLDENLNIQCEVPYASEHCYIKSPNGTEYLMPNNFESLLGTCSVTIVKTKPEHIGDWYCYFARKTGTPDEQITVKVAAAEILLYTTKIEATSGGNASLLCSSYGLPLKYCRFAGPNSLSYYIEDRQNSSRISYNGRGLEYGECGITISNVQTSDSGVWTCITKIGDDYRQDEVSATIDLDVAPTFLENPTTAICFGSAGAVLVVSGVVFFGVKKWRKRRLSLSTCINSNSSEEGSRENICVHEYPCYSSLQHESSDSHDHQP